MSERENRGTWLLDGLQQVSERVLAAACELPGTPDELYKNLRKQLIKGLNRECLLTPQPDINRLLQKKPSGDGKGILILGGVKDQRRQSHGEVFQRHDGAYFHFSITVAGQGRATTLLAYAFELYFVEPHLAAGLPRFVRFDLNKSDHDNAKRSMRSHVHPGHDDLQAPSPWWQPEELLDLFLYGLEPRDKPRAKG